MQMAAISIQFLAHQNPSVVSELTILQSEEQTYTHLTGKEEGGHFPFRSLLWREKTTCS